MTKTRPNTAKLVHTLTIEGYITIQKWMMKVLDLRGVELLLFALINGFSMDGQGTFHGGAAYAADWCGCSDRSVKTALASMEQRALIKRVGYNGQKIMWQAMPETAEAVAKLLMDLPLSDEEELLVRQFGQLKEGEKTSLVKELHRCKDFTSEKTSLVKELHPQECKNFTSSGEKTSPHIIKDKKEINNPSFLIPAPPQSGEEGKDDQEGFPDAIDPSKSCFPDPQSGKELVVD